MVSGCDASSPLPGPVNYAPQKAQDNLIISANEKIYALWLKAWINLS